MIDIERDYTAQNRQDDCSRDKQVRYFELVEKRKQCGQCKDLKLTNPSKCDEGVYDIQGHIGPWTQWQGNLNADLMIVGQDWGSKGYYIENEGVEKDTNATNRTIRELLSSIDIQIALPNLAQRESAVFFTNSILCLRPGNGLTGPTPPVSSFDNCSKSFLRPQIELVNPKVVVTLGHKAYSSVLKAYDRKPHPLMTAAVGEIIPLAGRTCLIPVFHPGHYGSLTRSIQEQKKDWQQVRRVLNEVQTSS